MSRLSQSERSKDPLRVFNTHTVLHIERFDVVIMHMQSRENVGVWRGLQLDLTERSHDSSVVSRVDESYASFKDSVLHTEVCVEYVESVCIKYTES